ncbi:hypothetical protein M407DRAFT_29071 [Tulasnella calospora MUT 4182]|uniref:BTB domain-containing protein n=1 Tax=Tulasnella calospora MUT 4182 TaxID=1051891 RepID=A0A0C3QAR6_9AGAM|nr:hypothetical protein M407DRAFT_29071 [Tulasnella calospora MUT 4182]
MTSDPPQSTDDSWADAEFFSDEEESTTNAQGWRSFDKSGGHIRSASPSIRSERSTSSDEPAPSYSHGDFKGLKIKFESEDGQRTWTEPAHLFTEDSPLFNNVVEHDRGVEIFNPDPISKLPGLKRHPIRKLNKGPGERLKYRLEGVTPFDFDSLMVGLRPKLGQEIPYERLCPMLVLATDWAFESIRNYTIAALSKHEDLPIPRILIARRARVPQWLLDPYVTLSTRMTPLSKYEAKALGIDSVLKISDARAKVLERRLSLIAGPRPGTFLNRWTFFHSNCWMVASAAWRKALTETKYHKPPRLNGPRTTTAMQAMQAALQDQAQKPGDGRRLCAGCQATNGLAEWLNLSADSVLVRRYLKAAIGSEVELWAKPSNTSGTT